MSLKNLLIIMGNNAKLRASNTMSVWLENYINEIAFDMYIETLSACK